MRAVVIVARLLLLLVAAGAVVSAFALSRRHDRAARTAASHYVCPMHPEATSKVPGDCPICRMALERVGSPTPPAFSSASSAPAPRSTGDAGSTSPSPDQPADARAEAVTSSPQRRIVAREVSAPAWVDGSGRVEAVLYNDDLAGLSPGARGVFFRAVAPTVGVAVGLIAQPPVPRDGSTSRAYFRLQPPAPASDRVRPRREAGPPEVGWVKLALKPRELLVVPSGAILTSPHGPYVLAAPAKGDVFTRRPVEIGTLLGGSAVVLSGVREEERVIVGNAFFLDAERRMQPGREGTVAVVQ